MQARSLRSREFCILKRDAIDVTDNMGGVASRHGNNSCDHTLSSDRRDLPVRRLRGIAPCPAYGRQEVDSRWLRLSCTLDVVQAAKNLKGFLWNDLTGLPG
jgi:hypothetical protein